MKTYHIITYGCQMNWSDSERIAGYLKKNNFKPADLASADLIILNLCSVRQTAINRVWGKIKYIKTLKHKNIKTKPIIILTGCILPADKKKLTKKVDLILDIRDLPRWLENIKTLKHKSIKTKEKHSHNNSQKFASPFACAPAYQSKFQAYIPIMTGCDNFCSYCVVPYTRGREISRPAEEIINEVNKLVAQGYKLIILLGQNVNSYNSRMGTNALRMFPNINSDEFGKHSKKFGKDISLNFPDLLKLINSISGNYWLSFITSHPKDMSDELIKCFKDCEHLIPYLHLPLQAGSDKILKAMNRKYTATHYENLIKKIRMIFASNSHQNSHVTITTDIIVGFPGETKKDFQKTANFMKSIKFDMAYLAEYSPRADTASAKLKDNVSAEEKTQRRVALNEILKKTAWENNKKMVGKEVKVLIERIVGTGLDLSAYGKTRNFKDVKIVCHPREGGDPEKTVPGFRAKPGMTTIKIGDFIKVKIIKAGPWSLEGKLIK